MFSNLKCDLARYSRNGEVFNKLKICLVSHSFHMVLLYRMGSFFSKVPVIGSFVRVIIEYFLRVVYASDISLRSNIGPGLVIMHGHDIVIGGDVRIGMNCKILNGVTLGNKDTELDVNQQPILGDNVVIGSGAKILGSIEVGDNVIIGANSVIIKDIPSNVTVAGVPGRIVK
jgi:serine O-acetyltransferase